jgi:hypothetical protein
MSGMIRIGGTYSINLRNGNRFTFKTFRAFSDSLTKNYSPYDGEILYLGWSDGYNSCGYSFNDSDVRLALRQNWLKIIKEVEYFADLYISIRNQRFRPAGNY